MGQKTSVLKVTSNVTVPGDCGAVDTIRVSYKRRTCCGSRRRQIASFLFPRDKWLQQLSPEGMLRNASADVANVHVGKLSKKDDNTPVRVTCLMGKVIVFRAELSLADFLARLKYTEGGGRAVLAFSLAGPRLEATGPDEYAFTVMFCNGQRLDNGGAQRLSEPPQPQQHQPDQNSEPDNGKNKEITPDRGVMDELHQALNVEGAKGNEMGEEDPSLDEELEPEEEKVMGEEDPSLDVECVEEEQNVMGEEDPSQGKEWETEDEEVVGEEDPSLNKKWEEEEKAMGKEDPSVGGKGEEIQGGQGHVRGRIWDHVADCAAVVALGLMFYHAWLEYNTY